MFKKLLLMLSFVCMLPAASFASPTLFTFDVSLVSNSVVDTARSGVLGFDNWYIWKYRVDVTTGDDTKSGLSHWALELPNCYITSPNLFNEIEASAGWGGGDHTRVYIADGVNSDPTTGISGIKWDHVSGDGLDAFGEYDYFWFSAPTNESIDKDWAAKAGQDIVPGNIDAPDCPGCVPPGPGVPEPASLSLLGLGLLGLFRKKRARA